MNACKVSNLDTTWKSPLDSFNETILIFYILIREKVLDLCKMWPPPPPPPFLSNVHILRPSEPEKMVFANVSVCLFFKSRSSDIVLLKLGNLHYKLMSNSEQSIVLLKLPR